MYAHLRDSYRSGGRQGGMTGIWLCHKYPKPPDGGGGERALSWVAWEMSGVCKMKGRRSVPGPARQLVKPFPTGSSSAILKPQPTRWDAVIEGVGAGCWGSGFPLLEWERTGARGRVDGPVRPELGWDSCLI